MNSILNDSIRFTSNTSNVTFDSGDSFFQMFIYLMFVLGLIFVIAFILKKIGVIQAKMPRKMNDGIIDIIGQYTITQTEKIIAVKVLSSVQIIYSTQHAVTVLKEITYEEFESMNTPMSENEKPFTQILKSALSRGVK